MTTPRSDASRREDRRRGLTLAGLALAVVVAAVCVRLGVWQLHRLEQRRATDARIAARQALPPLDLAAPLPPVDSLQWRRVLTTGRFDTTLTFLLRGRSLEEVPGVDLVVPFRAGGPLVFLVNRGWLPAPDGESANPGGITPGGDVRLVGVLVPVPAPRGPQTPRPVRGTRNVLGVRWLDVAELSRQLGAPVYPLAVQELPQPGVGPWPRARALPPPSNGPHLSYAIQWFGFALVVLIGSILLVASRVRRPGA